MPLTFLGTLSASPQRDLLTWDKTDVPRDLGAYVLFAGSGTLFRYPGGQSPVFYIGQSRKLRGRLNKHRVAILQARDNRTRCLFRPIPEYGAVFGACYSFVRAEPGGCPKALEDELMAKFAEQFRSLPVANGAGAYRRLRRIIDARSAKSKDGG